MDFGLDWSLFDSPLDLLIKEAIVLFYPFVLLQSRKRALHLRHVLVKGRLDVCLQQILPRQSIFWSLGARSFLSFDLIVLGRVLIVMGASSLITGDGSGVVKLVD